MRPTAPARFLDSLLLLAALCACASYRLLPLPAASGASQALPVQYEKSRFLFFKSIERDGLLDRFFAREPLVLATVVRPASGVFSSQDAGGSWAFASLPGEDRVLREVLFGEEEHVYARAGARVLHSADGGRSWSASVPGGEIIDALALGAGGALLAAGRGRLFVSQDRAQTWRTLSMQSGSAWRARSLLVDPAHPGTIFVSIHGEEQQPRDLLTRFTALLDYSSDEAVSALKLADSREEKPRAIAWGALSGDGVYYSQDGGALWKKSGLALDAWLAAVEGDLYAVAADPILQAAALVRRYPDLAALADRQMHGDKADPAGLRAACRFVGREKLMMGPVAAALVLRSQDGGASWARVADPPLKVALALREAVERGRWESAAAPSRPPPSTPQRMPAPGSRASRFGNMANPQRTGVPRALQRGVATETLLAFIDPLRLLAHFNAGFPLAGVAGGAAYVATESWWTAVTEAMASESESEGEMSLGPGMPAAQAAPAFEILRSFDGSSWQPQHFDLPPSKAAAFPESIAATPEQIFLVIGSRDQSGQTWRAGFRLSGR